jgi:hypothetical protein
MSDEFSFKIQEETDDGVTNLACDKNVIALCIIAPFLPQRIAPKRSISAQFSFPDEFILEEFVESVSKIYPEKEERPPLHLLIHSFGGAVASSYMAARVLRDNFNNIIGYIPHIAASGATVLALSCNEIVMGDISRITGIDPSYEGESGESFHPLSIVRSFETLERILGAKTIEEISFPYQHLVQTITAEMYDQATNSLEMVNGYTTELMEKAGYNKTEIKKVVKGLLYDISIHEEVLTLDHAKELGIKAKHYTEDPSTVEYWKMMKTWLKNYYLKPSPMHIIKYCTPKSKEKTETKEEFKNLENNT